MHLMHINNTLQNGKSVMHGSDNVNLLLCSSCKDKSPACMSGHDIIEVKGYFILSMVLVPIRRELLNVCRLQFQATFLDAVLTEWVYLVYRKVPRYMLENVRKTEDIAILVQIMAFAQRTFMRE